MTTATLRKRVRKLFVERFGEGEALHQLDALICRSWAASEKRNDYLHSFWAANQDRSEFAFHDGQKRKWSKAPSATEIEELALELNKIFWAVLNERMRPGGFFYELLKVRNAP